MNRVQPIKPNNTKPFYKANASYFQTDAPAEYASFMYDAVITEGLSACAATPDSREEFGVAGPSSLAHVKQVPMTEFLGASGQVRFKYEEEENGMKEYENSRNP